MSKSEFAVLSALNQVRAMLPFAILGLDTDNGSEFINQGLLDWCTQNQITFTRSREYKKNDQAHVEEKNGSVVRRLVGYSRFEGAKSFQLLGQLYAYARLYTNFFQPSLKLRFKEREGGNVKRLYEKAATPFARICERSEVTARIKNKLLKQFRSLDPVVLLQEIEKLQAELWQTEVIVEEYASQKLLREFLREQLKPGARKSDKPQIKKRQREPKLWKPPTLSSGAKAGKKSNLDDAWPEVCAFLDLNPGLVPRQVLALLEERYPGRFRKTQISTITDKLRIWRCQNSLPIHFEKLRPGKKSNIDEVWQLALTILEGNPTLSCNGLMDALTKSFPDQVNKGQRTAVYTRLKEWRKQNLPSAEINSIEITGITILEAALDVVSKIPQEG